MELQGGLESVIATGCTAPTGLLHQGPLDLAAPRSDALLRAQNAPVGPADVEAVDRSSVT